MNQILTLNAGSSSIKFSVFDDALQRKISGQVERLGPKARLKIKADDAQQSRDLGQTDHAAAVAAILDALGPHVQGMTISGVGHRITHGGMAFTAPCILTPNTIEALGALAPLAPLHQPHNLAAVRAACDAFPNALQVGCFDTAFHRKHPFVNDTFALPRALYDQGIRRYGFHGLSYDYVSEQLELLRSDLAKGRVIIAHLGNGASMCACQNGVSIGSTMGFSALDGLPMGTRCGQLDPGVLLYLMNERGMTGPEIEHLLYRESGLKGLSGISHDMRDLLASDDPAAKETIDYYVFRIRREIGGMVAVLGGLDALVFCGGVGENAPEIRRRVTMDMDWLGLELNETANAENAVDIGNGLPEIMIIPTSEATTMARATAKLLQDQGPI
jgi:acetate kinase